MANMLAEVDDMADTLAVGSPALTDAEPRLGLDRLHVKDLTSRSGSMPRTNTALARVGRSGQQGLISTFAIRRL